MGNSAPGVDAIAEVQVLSNSYSAEYGGLAGVVVTTKRGGNAYHGTAFYDFNDNSLNALTYSQKLTGATRDDPNSDTYQHRWGASFGGPHQVRQDVLLRELRGLNATRRSTAAAGPPSPPRRCETATSRARRFTIKDPPTGLPFPGNVIPASRIDPSATNIINFFYPLPNQGTALDRQGVYQKFVPETANRQRADLRLDHELLVEGLALPAGELPAP